VPITVKLWDNKHSDTETLSVLIPRNTGYTYGDILVLVKLGPPGKMERETDNIYEIT